METTQFAQGTSNEVIYWEGKGWYYFMNGWKKSQCQETKTETDYRKFFSSLEEVNKIFSKVVKVQ